MAWLRNHVRTATLVAAGACCLCAALARPAYAAKAGRELPGTEVVRLLRSLLDTVALGSVATYQRLGLQAGPGVQQFYTSNGYQPVWTQPRGWNPTARQALGWLAKAGEYGLLRDDYAWESLQALPDSLQLPDDSPPSPQLAVAELRLTDALLRYADHLRRGRLPGYAEAPPHSGPISPPVNRLLRALATGSLTGFIADSQPSSRAYQQLVQAWQAALAAACPEDSARLLSGEQALFRRVAINLERLRWQAAPDSEYAVVNIPAFQLQIIRQGRVVQTHRVVVGKPTMPTPTLSSRIIVFVTSPDWRVPYSIAVNELLPEIQRDPGFLADNGYQLLNAAQEPVNPWRVRWREVTPATFRYSIRQSAGRQNALGKVVFYFPNSHTVFLHDTPVRAVFTRPSRALSHGCVRVENPLALAAYLLRREGTEAALRPALTGPTRHERHRFDLPHGLPIQLCYLTCTGEQGRLRSFPDIYGKDEALLAAFFAGP